MLERLQVEMNVMKSQWLVYTIMCKIWKIKMLRTKQINEQSKKKQINKLKMTMRMISKVLLCIDMLHIQKKGKLKINSNNKNSNNSSNNNNISNNSNMTNSINNKIWNTIRKIFKITNSNNNKIKHNKMMNMIFISFTVIFIIMISKTTIMIIRSSLFIRQSKKKNKKKKKKKILFRINKMLLSIDIPHCLELI